MSKIEIGRFSERLRRSFGMAGVVDVATELAPEISPVVVIEDNAPELQFLQQVRLCVGGAVQGAAVGLPSIFRYRNPAGSGVLVTFTQVMVSPTVTGTLLAGYGVTQADLATVSATAIRDSRWDEVGGVGTTTIIGSRGNVALGFTRSLFTVRSAADFSYEYKVPFMVFPGESLEVGGLGFNVEMHIGLSWRERALPSLEQ